MSIAERIAQLPGKPFTAGEAAHFEHAPCFVCGYSNGEYYQTAKHPCAARYHAFKNHDDGWLYERFTIAPDAIDAYLKAVDTRRNADEWVHNQVRITELENAAIAAEADLRLVRDMK